ncbi:TRAP transporter small permease [Roseinatronobacter sp. S2]|uniref:TRAP transporter small permease n=1 Tax=Roseinatronobacter sp. S2 TaxID=3035471 RepID=UPI00240EB21A|nr:TRAP transporter small permease subunit [Roseinatronobacter sp. S2]WFE76514.1 TRAP transporter small permease subunit [Roseinatronobacter sp. S2]
MLALYRKAEFILGMIILAVITALVFVAAVMRFFGQPLIWSVDMAQLLFIWLCFIGATKALRERAHLGVDLLVRRLPLRARLLLETAIAGVALVFLAALAWHGTQLTLLNLARQFGDSGLSYAWVTGAVPAGCVILSASLIANVIEAWRMTGQRVFTRATSMTDGA